MSFLLTDNKRKRRNPVLSARLLFFVPALVLLCLSPGGAVDLFQEQALFRTAVKHFEAACKSEATSYIQSHKQYLDALDAARTVMAKYPFSPLAKSIGTRTKKIGDMSLPELEKYTARIEKKAAAEEYPLACARYLVLQTTRAAGVTMPMAHLARCFAGAGRIEKARDLAGRLDHPDIKVRTLSAIAGVLIERGQNKTALELLQEAKEVARWLGSSPFELNALLDLARRFHDAGHTNQADHLLTMALETAQKPAAPFSQVELQTEIAGAYTALGKEIFASTLLTEAFNLATMIDNPLFKATVLGRIAEGYHGCGQSSLAQLTLAETLRTAQTAKSKATMSEALAVAAVSYAAVGKEDRAHKLLEKAVIIARAEPVEFSSQGALLAISESYLEIGSLDQALKITEAIDYFSFLDNKRVLMQEIAERFARGGDCDQALQLVKAGDVMSPDAVLYRIAVAFTDRDRLDKAYATTTSVRDAYFKAKILTEIGSRLAETGQRSKAAGFLLDALRMLTTVKQSETGRLYRIITLADIGLTFARFQLPVDTAVRETLHTLIAGAEELPDKKEPLQPPEQVVQQTDSFKIKMIIGTDSFKQVGIEYRESYYTLGLGDKIGDHYKVLDIYEFSIKVLDLKTKKELIVTIEPF